MKWATLFLVLLLSLQVTWAEDNPIHELRAAVYDYTIKQSPEAVNMPDILSVWIDELTMTIATKYPPSQWNNPVVYPVAESLATDSLIGKHMVILKYAQQYQQDAQESTVPQENATPQPQRDSFGKRLLKDSVSNASSMMLQNLFGFNPNRRQYDVNIRTGY